jgi:hypothetical protein
MLRELEREPGNQWTAASNDGQTTYARTLTDAVVSRQDAVRSRLSSCSRGGPPPQCPAGHGRRSSSPPVPRGYPPIPSAAPALPRATLRQP